MAWLGQKRSTDKSWIVCKTDYEVVCGWRWNNLFPWNFYNHSVVAGRKSHESSNVSLRSSFLKSIYNDGFLLVRSHNVLGGICMLIGTLEQVFIEFAWVDSFQEGVDCCFFHFKGDWRNHSSRFEDGKLKSGLDVSADWYVLFAAVYSGWLTGPVSCWFIVFMIWKGASGETETKRRRQYYECCGPVSRQKAASYGVELNAVQGYGVISEVICLVSIQFWKNLWVWIVLWTFW